jgi:hypothetical protein
MSNLTNTFPEIAQAPTARSNCGNEPSAMGAMNLFRLPPLCSKLANFSGHHLLTG